MRYLIMIVCVALVACGGEAWHWTSTGGAYECDDAGAGGSCPETDTERDAGILVMSADASAD